MRERNSIRSRSLCSSRPRIRAKRHRGKTGAIEECGGGVGLPCVSNLGGVGHGRRGDYNGGAVDARVSPEPFAVVSGDGEFFELVALDDQTAFRVREMKPNHPRLMLR